MYIYLPCIDPAFCNFLELFDNPLCIYENVHGILKHEENTSSEIKNYLDSVNFKTKIKLLISLFTTRKFFRNCIKRY